MHNQSFRQVLVAKTGMILANGTTTDLAPNQVGIFDYPSYKATNGPNYTANKTIIIARGVNPGTLTINSFISNSPEYTKEISGLKITGWRGVKAHKGRQAIYAIGYDGYDTAKTLFAQCGENRHIYIRLTGRYINELYSEKGITRQFSVKAPSCTDCGDNCANVDAALMADDLVNQINADSITGKFLKAKKLQYCTNAIAVTGTPYTKWYLNVTDGGHGEALGIVQSQYPGKIIVYEGQGNDSLSSLYAVVTADTVAGNPAVDTPNQPADFSNAAITLLPDCNACPAGYTQLPGGIAYKITIQDNGADKNAEVQGLPGAVANSAKKIGEQFGQGLYTVIVAAALTDVQITTFKTTEASAVFQELGTAGSWCQLTAPGTIAWTIAGSLSTYGKQYLLTLAGQCNNDRLAEIQAAYPNLAIALDAPAPDGNNCIFRYKVTVQSNFVETGCSMDVINWTVPDPFEGTAWTEATIVPNVNSTCSYGVEITVGVVDRITGECTYDYWAEQFDTIHIQISEFNPDYNGSPNQTPWAVTKLQAMAYPVGTGGWVREQEKRSLSYQLRERSLNPIIRELEGYAFAADANMMYDEYTLEYAYGYRSGGPGGYVTDPYHVQVYFPTGQGKQFEAAINGYVSASQIGLDPVIL